MEIGNKIAKVRKEMNLTQEQLAERVNISTTHMSHIETGNTKLSLPVLVHIAQALHTTTDELLFDSYHFQKESALHEIQTVLDACPPPQAKIISEIVKSAKIAMDKYN